MTTSKLIETYKGFKIKKRTSSESRHGELDIYYPDGVRSVICAVSVEVAKRIIDNYVNKTFDMYAAA